MGEPGAVAESGAVALQEICDDALHTIGSALPAAQLRALLTVEEQGPLTLGVLARTLRASPSATSRLCDRLVAAGLVTRGPTGEDRRAVDLTLTPAGWHLVAWVHRERRAHLARRLEKMSPAGRAALLEGLTELATPSDQTG